MSMISSHTGTRAGLPKKLSTGDWYKNTGRLQTDSTGWVLAVSSGRVVVTGGSVVVPGSWMVVVIEATVDVVLPTPIGSLPPERRTTGIIRAATNAAPAANMSTGLGRDLDGEFPAMSVSSGKLGASGDIAARRRIKSLIRFSSLMTGAPQVVYGLEPDVS